MTATLTQEHLVSRLEGFRDWVKAHCKGRERGEAQVYLDRFFQCFELGGVLEAGGTFEHAQKASSKGGNTGFLDCLLPGIAIIEMKQRGSSLEQHYNQLLTYWTRCVPKPTVGILCNFDEFWIYDFNVQVDTPVQVLTLDQLSEHPEALLFMLGKKARFEQNMVAVTEDAASEISKLYRAILDRREQYQATEEDIQRFVLQCVLCLFAEDIDLLPNNLFTDLLNDCLERPSDTYNLLHGLFTQMNSKKPATAGRFKDVRYFNGGLFNTITPVELGKDEIATLHRIGYAFDWGKVRPSIFGTIFEKAIGHHQGSHFTSEVDIYKIVNPTIVRYWDERIESAGDNIKQLRQCLLDLRKYKVLDPACGSGNFLYIAYQEMKRLEKQLMDRIKEVVATSPKKFTAKDTEGTDISLVSPMQFYGIEIKPFAVELARLTLEIGRKVAVNKFGLTEDVLPLDNLNNNIICADALFIDWPKVDAIIGNPPFIGGYKLREEMGPEYTEKVYKAFPNLRGQPDFCVFWFRRAVNQKATRVGFVGTNSISQINSRRASLDYVVENGGIIHNAISTQAWSGEANVHVSIVNWVMGSKVKPPFYLDDEAVSMITAGLNTSFDVTKAPQLLRNKNLSFIGFELGSRGFLIPESKALLWKKLYPTVVKRLFDGYQLIDPNLPQEWVIDFFNMPIEEASLFKEPFEWLKENVKPEREECTDVRLKKNWWHYRRSGEATREALKGLTKFFANPITSKYTFFQAVNNDRVPTKIIVVASDDFYILGVLNSQLHRDWVKAQCSTLKSDTRYTNTTCFDTFPFLWDAPEKLKQPVRDTMTELENYRMAEMQSRQWGITKLYNAFFHEPASQLFKLHRQLDEAVCKVYGWKYDPDRNYNEDLFYLNQKLYEQEQAPLLANTKPKKQPKRAQS